MSYYPPNQHPPGSPYNPGTPVATGYTPGQQQVPYFPPPPGAQGRPVPPPPPQQSANAAPAIPAQPPGYETQQTYLTPRPLGQQQVPQPQPQWTSNIAGRQYQLGGSSFSGSLSRLSHTAIWPVSLFSAKSYPVRIQQWLSTAATSARTTSGAVHVALPGRRPGVIVSPGPASTASSGIIVPISAPAIARSLATALNDVSSTTTTSSSSSAVFCLTLSWFTIPDIVSAESSKLPISSQPGTASGLISPDDVHAPGTSQGYPPYPPSSPAPPPNQPPPASAQPQPAAMQAPTSMPPQIDFASPPPPPPPPAYVPSTSDGAYQMQPAHNMNQASGPQEGSTYQPAPSLSNQAQGLPSSHATGAVQEPEQHHLGYSQGVADLGPSISVSGPPAGANPTSQPSQMDSAFVHSPAQPKPSKPASAVENIILFTSPPPSSPVQLSQATQEGSAARHDIEGVTNAFQSMNVGFDPRMSMPPPPPPPPQPPQLSSTESGPGMPGDSQYCVNNPAPPQQERYQATPAQTVPPTPTQDSTERVQSYDSFSAPPPSAGPPLGPPPPDQRPRADYTTSTHSENIRQGHGAATTQWTPRNDWDRRYEKHGIKTLPVCIGSAFALKTTWYTHPSAPCYLICSRCYVDHIYPTHFKDDFKGEALEADKAHICRFPALRVKKGLFPQAVATGDLQPFLDYANARLGLPDCKGLKGAKGSEGIKWWRAKDDAIPGLVVCETCAEDTLKSSPFMAKFEPATGQAEEDVWSCDLAVPYLVRVFQKTRETGDWNAFMEAANLRIQLQVARPCPKFQQIPTQNRNFYAPLQGPRHMTICECCYLDRVKDIDGMDSQWFRSTKREEEVQGQKASCAMAEPNVLMLMLMTDEREDPSVFFKALARVTAEPHCGLEGVKTQRWYTLPSDPAGFGVCGACYEGTVEPWGISRFLKPKPTWSSDGEAHLCALSAGHPRFESMGLALLRTFFADDASQWDEYASVYADMPLCTRDNDLKSREWYGWPECTICPECFHEFCRGTALEAQMPWRRKRLTGYSMCEMYSPRMRGMYAEACSRDPPDATELRQYSGQRRVVYANTIMRCREMIREQEMALWQQRMLNQQSLFYTQLGRSQVNTIGSHYTYSQAGVGTFSSQWELDGARYGQQANEVMRNATRPSKTMMVAELERQWRAVE